MAAHQRIEKTQSNRLTLWIWPTGLYPRRTMFYLKAKAVEKSITLSTLSQTLTIIPVTLDTETNALESVPGHESRPPNTLLPCLRITRASDTSTTTKTAQHEYIYQSTSIINHLETIFPSPSPSRSLLGSNAIQAAQVSDVVEQLNESLPWASTYIRHSSPISLKMTGMDASEQSPTVAAEALKNWTTAIQRLEAWVRPHLSGGGRFLITSSTADQRLEEVDGGGEFATVADIILSSSHDYFLHTYGWDCLQDFQSLSRWVNGIKGASSATVTSSTSSTATANANANANTKVAAWYMSREELEMVEREGFEILFS